MDRPFGLPMGAATQSTGRSIPDNGFQHDGENGVPKPALNTARKILSISNTVRHTASSPSLSTQIPISAGQVVALAREAMKAALEENEAKAAEAGGISEELKPGVTIDLSHKQIQRFPEEVIDIIKNELERYSLSCPPWSPR